MVVLNFIWHSRPPSTSIHDLPGISGVFIPLMAAFKP